MKNKRFSKTILTLLNISIAAPEHISPTTELSHLQSTNNTQNQTTANFNANFYNQLIAFPKDIEKSLNELDYNQISCFIKSLQADQLCKLYEKLKPTMSNIAMSISECPTHSNSNGKRDRLLQRMDTFTNVILQITSNQWQEVIQSNTKQAADMLAILSLLNESQNKTVFFKSGDLLRYYQNIKTSKQSQAEFKVSSQYISSQIKDTIKKIDKQFWQQLDFTNMIQPLFNSLLCFADLIGIQFFTENINNITQSETDLPFYSSDILNIILTKCSKENIKKLLIIHIKKGNYAILDTDLAKTECIQYHDLSDNEVIQFVKTIRLTMYYLASNKSVISSKQACIVIDTLHNDLLHVIISKLPPDELYTLANLIKQEDFSFQKLLSNTSKETQIALLNKSDSTLTEKILQALSIEQKLLLLTASDRTLTEKILQILSAEQISIALSQYSDKTVEKILNILSAKQIANILFISDNITNKKISDYITENQLQEIILQGTTEQNLALINKSATMFDTMLWKKLTISAYEALLKVSTSTEIEKILLNMPTDKNVLASMSSEFHNLLATTISANTFLYILPYISQYISQEIIKNIPDETLTSIILDCTQSLNISGFYKVLCSLSVRQMNRLLDLTTDVLSNITNTLNDAQNNDIFELYSKNHLWLEAVFQKMNTTQFSRALSSLSQQTIVNLTIKLSNNHSMNMLLIKERIKRNLILGCNVDCIKEILLTENDHTICNKILSGIYGAYLHSLYAICSVPELEIIKSKCEPHNKRILQDTIEKRQENDKKKNDQ